jgi:hypothetical protein
MDHKKGKAMTDLFDFFKENEDKLKDAPSGRVWDQLEKQLETRKRRKRRKRLFLQMWLVILTLALLIMAAVAVYYFNGK